MEDNPIGATKILQQKVQPWRLYPSAHWLSQDRVICDDSLASLFLFFLPLLLLQLQPACLGLLSLLALAVR